MPNRIEELKEEDAARPRLFGTGETRKKLEEKGATFSGVYLGDFGKILNTTTGTSNVLGNFYLGADLDMEKLTGWTGGRIVTSILANHGVTLSDSVGDAQVTSNIEMGSPSVRIYEFFMEQKLAEQKLSVLAGIFDANSEFNVTEGSLLFLNSSFGLDAGLATSAFTGPSTFPVTTLGVRAKVDVSESVYLQSAILDGKPGSPLSFRSDQLHLDPTQEGYLHIHELGHLNPDAEATGFRKVAGGLWSYTVEQDSIDPNLAGTKDRPWGGYLLSDFGLSKQWSFTARYGFSNGNVQSIDRNIAIATVYKGIFGDLDHDQWGLGMTQAQFSKGQANQNVVDGVDAGPSETTIEATASWRLINGLYLQPDVQYVLNPNGLHGVQNPVVGYLRLQLNL